MTLVKVRIDVADESDEGVLNLTELLETLAASHDVAIRLVKEHGPAGWPVYEVEGEWARARRFVVELYGGKDVEANTLLCVPELARPPLDEDDDSDVGGYFLEHHRASGSSTQRFGPFDSVDEAVLWALEHDVTANVVPLYRTVDWARR